MHLLNRQDREDLGMNQLPREVRDYIAALETEYERVTTRQKRLRENIRAMQKKCELVNLKTELAQLAGKTAVVKQKWPQNQPWMPASHPQRREGVITRTAHASSAPGR